MNVPTRPACELLAALQNASTLTAISDYTALLENIWRILLFVINYAI